MQVCDDASLNLSLENIQSSQARVVQAFQEAAAELEEGWVNRGFVELTLTAIGHSLDAIDRALDPQNFQEFPPVEELPDTLLDLKSDTQPDTDQHEQPPDSQRPETMQVPDLQCPDTLQVPDSQRPETMQVPDLQCLDILQVPDSQCPDTLQVPDSQCSDTLQVPDSQCPDTLQVPDLQCPEPPQVPDLQCTEAQQVPDLQCTEAQQAPDLHTLPEPETADAKSASTIDSSAESNYPNQIVETASGSTEHPKHGTGKRAQSKAAAKAKALSTPNSKAKAKPANTSKASTCRPKQGDQEPPLTKDSDKDVLKAKLHSVS